MYRFVAAPNGFFYMREHIMHETNYEYYYHNPFPHFLCEHMIHLPSFVSFRGLISKYLH